MCGEAYRMPDGRVLEAAYANHLMGGPNWKPVFDQETGAAARAADGSVGENDWRPAKDIAERLFRSPGHQERFDNLLRDCWGIEPNRPSWMSDE
jgi:hypothetical protein